MKKYAIILGAGNGMRFKSAVPKQFSRIGNKPLLFYALETFHHTIDDLELFLVIEDQWVEYWKALMLKEDFNIPYHLVTGGNSRFQSVQNALEKIDGNGLVAIHDGARPLVSPQLVKNSFQEASQKGSAVPCVAVNDSLVLLKDGLTNVVSRDDYKRIQTPQCFDLQKIKQAYQQASHADFKDDASVLMDRGESVNLIEGEESNFKITHPQDLIVAEKLLWHKQLI